MSLENGLNKVRYITPIQTYSERLPIGYLVDFEMILTDCSTSVSQTCYLGIKSEQLKRKRNRKSWSDQLCLPEEDYCMTVQQCSDMAAISD